MKLLPHAVEAFVQNKRVNYQEKKLLDSSKYDLCVIR